MPPDTLNVIGLISGGKDSFFSLLHCIANGHKVVALANVYPAPQPNPSQVIEDAESYMYQTIGHQIIPLYSQALDLPLYREPIRGNAVNSGLDYKPPAKESNLQDETESLIPLLARVKEAHPEANAISTGAILSTYQRTRIESIALRMGLVPLSFLWQFPYLPPYRQSSLLEDMSAVGQKSIIVKVASGGLGVEFLGLDVSDSKVVSRLTAAMSRFGNNEVGNILGEGGEYETLAEDGLLPLWKGKVVPNQLKVLHGDTSSILQMNGGIVVQRKSAEDCRSVMPRRPDLLDSEFLDLLQHMEVPEFLHTNLDSRTAHKNEAFARKPCNHVNIVIKECPGKLVKISNVHCAQPDLNAAEQIRTIMSSLRILLQNRWITQLSAITFSTITLRKMKDFGEINAVYGSFFEEPNPPARATFACGDVFPDNVDVILSVIVDLNTSGNRNGLHVQSRSYWAPANIGPYSQAISIPARSFLYDQQQDDFETPNLEQMEVTRLVYIAGQIPLVPRSMEIMSLELYPEGWPKDTKQPISTFRLQAILALQHLWRIGRSMKVRWWTGAIAFISDCSPIEAMERAAVAHTVWEYMHSRQINRNDEPTEESADFDVWYARNNLNFSQNTTSHVTRSLLPDFTFLDDSDHPASTPPSFTVQVQELPRGASIEWLSLGISTTRSRSIEQHCVFEEDLIMHCCRMLPDEPIISFIGLRKVFSITTCVEHLLTWIPKELNETAELVHFFTVYVVESVPGIPSHWMETERAEVILCSRIWRDAECELEALVVVHSRKP